MFLSTIYKMLFLGYQWYHYGILSRHRSTKANATRCPARWVPRCVYKIQMVFSPLSLEYIELWRYDGPTNQQRSTSSSKNTVLSATTQNKIQNGGEKLMLLINTLFVFKNWMESSSCTYYSEENAKFCWISSTENIIGKKLLCVLDDVSYDSGMHSA